MIKGVIFDLDGTLLNTLYDLGNSTNRVLNFYGLDSHPVNVYKTFVGNGIKTLVKRAFPEGFEKLDEALELFIKDYTAHCMDESLPYDGILELLETLNTMQIPIAICTNKKQELTDMVIEKYFGAFPFVDVIGDRFDGFTKPNSRYPLEIAKKMDLAPEEIILLGDSDVDVRTAINAKMIPIGVSWGFRNEKELRDEGAKHIIHHPLELLELILSTRAGKRGSV